MYHPLFPLSKLHRPREHAFTTPIWSDLEGLDRISKGT